MWFHWLTSKLGENGEGEGKETKVIVLHESTKINTSEKNTPTILKLDISVMEIAWMFLKYGCSWCVLRILFER